MPEKIPPLCSEREYMCKDRFTCVQKTWLCDGEPECPAGDDEDPERCADINCRPDHFRCKNHDCIPGYLQCSGTAECSDGSDEVDCRKCLPNLHLVCILVS